MSILVILSCLLMLITATSCISLQQQGHISINQQVALFVFGDSLFDPGNNNYINTTTGYQANFEPYGFSYFSPPSGRFSNGRLISDFIAEYAGLPLISAYFEFQLGKNNTNSFVNGANFASGGAGALMETHAGFVIDLKTQLQYFHDLRKHFRRSLGAVKTKQLLSDAVYLFSCGANDYLSPLGYNDTSNALFMYNTTRVQYVQMVIGNLTRVFKGIYKKGGIKEFAICDNVNDYLFFDSVHLTQVANHQYADMFWSGGDSNLTMPYNLKTLFQGK
uniref:GDSL lipase-like n=1 Tax=Erigeron canadensis TaxID=72917 RepID=UPI001CB8CC0F|nr:GDSL lipase-like [Erigeron canadensis]